ncbi:zinc finger protein 367-like [Onthophagus taurus]|uniref:zinc finger protein 367-like n=1 Tax=Onthophagus taurus TaxID=166361 RepID=UPI000C200D34|nr:zinc finger protein 367-like [Onthophagus taurus]
MSRTPKRSKPSGTDTEISPVTPTNRIFKTRSPDFDKSPANVSCTLSPGEIRRGRPRAEVLNTLILQGSTSPSSIRCTFCNRVFPREKSLQAHLRTHTGEKPYACDFPRCAKRFAQSGQLKTHKRLHTGEKPFVCSAPNCDKRYTHANRHCPEHPNFQLKRYTSPAAMNMEKLTDEEHSIAVQEWFESVKRKEKRNSIQTTPKKASRSLNNGWRNENVNYLQNRNSENANMAAQALIELRKSHVAIEPSFPDLKIKQVFLPHDDFLLDNDQYNCQDLASTSSGYSDTSSKDTGDSTSPRSAEVSEIPKKRWRQQWDLTQEDLAQPLNWSEEGTTSVVEVENQKRPTVLVRNDKFETNGGGKKQVSRCDMQVAMALVELSNVETNNYNY